MSTGPLADLQRRAGNAAVASLLERRSASPRRVQRAVHQTIAAAFAAVGLPAALLANLSATLRGELADAQSRLPLVDFVAVPGLSRPAAVVATPGAAQPYRLDYNPAWPDQAFLAASIVHELQHVSADLSYRQDGARIPWLNLNVPPGLADAALGAELVAQQTVLDANLTALDNLIAADPTLGGPMRAHLRERVIYAQAMPDVHYDTVLVDMLAYMEFHGIQAGRAHAYLARLLREAADRRLVDPWWGTKRARAVNPNAAWWQVWEW